METKKPAKEGELVLPGDYLGVIEEYLPSDGVKEENGNLIATRAGRVRINMEKMDLKFCKFNPCIAGGKEMPYLPAC